MFDPISYKEARKVDEKHTLKSAQIERELKEYQQTLANVNVNQEAKQSVTDYGIVSLPENAASGQMSVGLKGLTASNIINGQGYSLDGWENVGAQMYLGVGERAGYFEVDTTGGVAPYYGFAVASGHKYYSRAIYATNADSGALRAELRSGVSNVSNLWVLEAPQATDAIISGVVTATNDGDRIVLSRTAGLEALFWLKNWILIDLTATFGAGNEPDKDTCDKMFADWFDGTRSVAPVCRIKSVGKNLFGGKWEIGTLAAHDGSEVPSTTKVRTNYFRVPANTALVKSCSAPFRVSSTYFYDKNKNFITANINMSLMSPANAYYVRQLAVYDSAIGDTGYYNNNIKFQLELGSSPATPYEPYTESTLYLTAGQELRSLPNGTKDEISEGNKLIKRVSDWITVNGDKNWTNFTVFENVYRSEISGSEYGTNISSQASSVGIINNQQIQYLPGYTVDAESYYIASNTNLILKIAKSKIDAMPSGGTLAGLKEYLNQYPITLLYQLAEPIITPIQSSGTLLSNPSGTVYWETALADAGVYGDGISVLLQDYPIAELETLSKVEFETGIETSLDASKAVLSPDGLSFTHLDLQDGDIAFFTYFYDAESTVPEMCIEYYDSRYTVQDSVTGKFYKWTVSVADGVASIDLVEV